MVLVKEDKIFVELDDTHQSAHISNVPEHSEVIVTSLYGGSAYNIEVKFNYTKDGEKWTASTSQIIHLSDLMD